MRMPSNEDPNTVCNFLQQQIEFWIPEIVNTLNSEPTGFDIIHELRIGGESLEQIFGRDSINGFLRHAGLQGAIDTVSVLMDLLSIVSLMAYIVQNFRNMQLISAIANLRRLYRRANAHFRENEQFYRQLLESLRLLVPNRDFILRVALSICSRIRHRANNFARYIIANVLTLT